MPWFKKKETPSFKAEHSTSLLHQEDEHCSAANCPAAYLPSEFIQGELREAQLAEQLASRPIGYQPNRKATRSP